MMSSESTVKGGAGIVALGYRYPTESSHSTLVTAMTDLEGKVGRGMQRFVDRVGQLTIGEWEELHTRTLDLSPLFIPYVGYVLWGENYRRGEFMADLKRDMERLGVDLKGELPDHLDPILRYLEVATDPLNDLIVDLPKAIDMMRTTLKKADSDNPYRHLLAATASYVDQIPAIQNPTETGAPR